MNVKDFHERVASLGCVICRRREEHGYVPASVHHIAPGSSKRSEWSVAPLCHEHHQGRLGLHGMGSKAFCKWHKVPMGEEWGLLIWMIEDLMKAVP